MRPIGLLTGGGTEDCFFPTDGRLIRGAANVPGSVLFNFLYLMALLITVNIDFCYIVCDGSEVDVFLFIIVLLAP